MIKCTGLEWKKFYRDDSFWGEGSFHEDEVVFVDGIEVDQGYDLASIDDNSEFKISGGNIFLNGSYDKEISLEGHFRKWRKLQTEETIVFSIGKEKAVEAKNILKSMGATLS